MTMDECKDLTLVLIFQSIFPRLRALSVKSSIWGISTHHQQLISIDTGCSAQLSYCEYWIQQPGSAERDQIYLFIMVQSEHRATAETSDQWRHISVSCVNITSLGGSTHPGHTYMYSASINQNFNTEFLLFPGSYYLYLLLLEKLYLLSCFQF